MLNLIEAVLGRRWMWKLGRRLYLHARREGSLDIETNGEAQLQRALADYAARGNRALTVFDVGANFGQWSISLLQALKTAGAPKARITLFEPVPAIRAALGRSLEDWTATVDVRIEAMALSDSPGTETLVVTGEATGTHHLLSDTHNFAGERIEVEVTTLDHYLADHPCDRVDFVKIDAEGYDPSIMKGMEGLLARGQVDVIQFEYSVHFVRSRSFLADVFQLAERHGYRVGLLTDKGIELHEAWHPDLERFYASAMVVVRGGGPTHLPSWQAHYRPDNTRNTAPAL